MRDRHHSVENRQAWLLTRGDRPSGRPRPRSWRHTLAAPVRPPRRPSVSPTRSRLAETTAPGCRLCPAISCWLLRKRSKSARVQGHCRCMACRSVSTTASMSRGADHTLLPRLRLRCVDDGPGGAAPARRGRVVRRQDESGPVRHRTQRHPHALHHPAQCVRRRDAFGSPFPPAVYIGHPGWKDAAAAPTNR
jgi:hypothetical protein